MRTRGLWFAIALLAGCHGEDPPAARPAGSGSGSGSGSAAAPVPPPAMIALFVDDAAAGQVSRAQVDAWPRLDAMVPPAARRLGMWQDVYLKGKTAKPTELHQPSATYPELVPALFPGEDGLPAFGMFDPVELAKHGKAALVEYGVHEIRIKLNHDSGRGEHEEGQSGGGAHESADPNDLKLTVKTARGEQVIEGKKLLAIPRQRQPGDEGGEPKGWPLTLILELAGVKSYQRLLLTDAAGLNLTLEKVDLDPKVAVPFIKLNRQGQLRFRVFKKQGQGWVPSGDLRDLQRIEILK
jgi:hypothetical protein